MIIYDDGQNNEIISENESRIELLNVYADDEYNLWLSFSDGEKKVFDMSSFLHIEEYEPLKIKKLFKTAKIEHNCVVWSCGVGIMSEYLYNYSKWLS